MRAFRVTVLLLAGWLAAAGQTSAADGLVVGRKGAVAAEHRLASEAGLQMLLGGGNAVDAAAAASLATGVVNPSSSGLGGGGFMVLFLADDSRTHTIDYRERAPSSATRGMYVRGRSVDAQASKTGGRAVAIPGEVAGLALALERFGTKSFAEVAAPAIQLARDGFVVEKHLARVIKAFRDSLAGDPELARTFLHDDGTPIEEGELLERPGLADTLERIAKDGPSVFYEGEIAADIIETIRASGGDATAADLAGYKPVQRPPVVVRYRRWRVVGMPPPSSGGGVIGQTLNLLAPYRPYDLGAGTSTYLHVLAESFKASFADRARYYGDPDFVKVPLGRLLSQAHAAEVRARFSAVETVPPATYGQAATARDAGTAHISVVDAYGNAVACTSSVNTPFGAMLAVRGRDIILNNTMDDFSAQPDTPNAYGLVGGEANAIAASKRPLSSMSPTIVIEGDAVRLVAGGSGGPRIISATAQTILNVLDFSMDVGRAVRAPRIHHQWVPDVLGVEQGIPESVRASLARRGHRIVPITYPAAVQAVEVLTDAEGRLLRAQSDPRKGGVAAAY